MEVIKRPSHPELYLHQMFVTNLKSLIQNIKLSKADQNDNLYNFFSQFINATMGEFDETFKEMVSNAIYNDYSNVSPRLAAVTIIKQYQFDWPEQFMCTQTPRIYLSDIRNQIVFEFWSQFQRRYTCSMDARN